MADLTGLNSAGRTHDLPLLTKACTLTQLHTLAFTHMGSLAIILARLLGKALGSCTASSTANKQVWVELQQLGASQLVLKVQDNGLGQPDDVTVLQRALAELRLWLASPLLQGGLLSLRTTGSEEAVFRVYSAAAQGDTLAVMLAATEPKPPGLNFQGSEASVVIKLDAVLLEDVIGCAEQLLSLVKILGPPARLGLRTRVVLVLDESGRVQPTTYSREVAASTDGAVPQLQLLHQGMMAAFVQTDPTSIVSAGGLGSQDSSRSGGDGDSQAANYSYDSSHGGFQGLKQPVSNNSTGAPAVDMQTDTQQPLAGQAQGQCRTNLPLLSYVGVGEAGWGCERAAEQYRGCKWTARAGIVLQLPDHERLPMPYEPPTALDPTPVFLFRNYTLQHMQLTGAQSPALKGLGKCDWGEFGFQLSGSPSPAGAAAANAAGRGSTKAGRTTSTACQGREVSCSTLCSLQPLASAIIHLQCAQPRSGARVVAVVVHLQSAETRSEAATGKPLPLAATYEARMVRAALEGALRHLKEQTPAVVASRRDRSQLRCGPYLARSVAGIIQRSLDREFVQQALGLLSCSKQLAGAQLEGLLTPEAIASLQPAAETTEYEAQKRQRT